MINSCNLCGKELIGKQKKYCCKRHSFYVYSQNLKLEVLQHYSQHEKPFCLLCTDNDIDVLTLHHLENNGNEHRKELPSGYNTYFQLKKDNYVSDYTFHVLCSSCNIKIQSIVSNPLYDKKQKNGVW